jgi:aryl-alcohol dehydrogenase-like predicted oxidoreductase
MNLCSKLGLGTVQWGMPYGIANLAGRRPQSAEIERILHQSHEAGVEFLDTAQVYGEAESIIGQHALSLRGWRIVTKTMPLPAGVDAEVAIDLVASAFHQSLARLKCSCVYGLLVHRSEDLMDMRGELLWALLEELKLRGLVSKIGVSVYDPHELDLVLTDRRMDIVQVPCNLYDQRFLRGGWLERMRRMGVEIHARSAFLQGLLLMPADRLPAQFAPWRDHHQKLHSEWKTRDVAPLVGSLRFCLEQPMLDRVIVGCETPAQLQEILRAAASHCNGLPDAASFSVDNGDIIDPRRWAKN